MESDVRFRRSLVIGMQDLPPILATVNGTTRFDAEVLLASELGYRAQPRANLSLDLAGFYNDYRNLRGYATDSLRVVVAGTGIVMEAPNTFNNQDVAHAYGLEAVLDWRPLRTWRLQGSATFMDMRTPGDSSSAGNNPDRQFLLRSEVNLTPQVELDAALRVVSQLEAHRVPAYTALDLRLGWRPLASLDLDFVGRNLFAGRHLEFVDEFLELHPAEIPSDFYVKAAWRF